MDTTPTLFLDFDGVLHSAEINAINRHGEFVPHPDLFAWVPILDGLLKPYPELRIVVSSDWRLVVDDLTLRRILGPLGSRFFGVMETMVQARADAVKAEARRRGLSAWLAVDDHPTVVTAAGDDARFIVCEPTTGINAPAVQREMMDKLAGLCLPPVAFLDNDEGPLDPPAFVCTTAARKAPAV